MTKRWDLIKGIVIAAAMGLLILDAETALEGANSGITLCIQTVIPSLFPFFILSILLTGAWMGTKISILQPICCLLRIPKGSETILIAGIFGGYPVGAQCVSQAFEQGQLSARDARRMLSFCSNCGPAFLFGMIGTVFDEKWIPWALWGVHLLSAMLVSLVIPGENGKPILLSSAEKITIPTALNKALRIMASVCGWVVIFRIIIQFLQRWFLWLLPTEWQVAVCGLLELSNGCVELRNIENTTLRFILCAGFLSFSGLCVTMQTYSVLSPKLDRRLYFPGKVLQCCFSLMIGSVLFLSAENILQFLWIPTAIAILLIVFLRKTQNNSSIPSAVGV